jgi:hypothetical protein
MLGFFAERVTRKKTFQCCQQISPGQPSLLGPPPSMSTPIKEERKTPKNFFVNPKKFNLNAFISHLRNEKSDISSTPSMNFQEVINRWVRVN